MAITIQKAKMEKGKLYLTTDTNKNIVVDVNAGVIYGVSGKALKTCPAYRSFMNDYDKKKIREAVPALNALGEWYQTGDRAIDSKFGLKRLRYADRLVNMGISPQMVRSILCSYHRTYNIECDLDNNETYKLIAKVLKTVPNAISYEAALEEYETAMFMAKHKASFEGLTEAQCKLARELINEIGEKHTAEICSWIRFDHYEILGKRISWGYNNRGFWGDLKRYVQFCEKHSIEIPKRGLYVHLCTTWLTYLSVKDEEKNERLLEAYKVNSEKFFFENEQFTMVFPKTVQDFVTEGDALRHCVGWNGYDDRVVEGDCVIAFIRKKTNPEKAFYTCDLRKGHCGNWYINQFLGQNNCGIGDNAELMEYYLTLGEFLKKIS